MPPFLEKSRLVGWLTLVLASAFVTTGGLGYKVARDSIQQAFAANTVPATSELIFADVERDLLRRAAASSLIASDAFVRNWFAGGERDADALVRYLQQVDRKLGSNGSFVISERSHRQYLGSGVLKPLSPTDSPSAWFSRGRDTKLVGDVMVARGPANGDSVLVSIGHRITDEHGQFLGAAGVSMPLSLFSELIDTYRARFGCRVYFVDSAGIIVLGNEAMQHVRDLPSLRRVSNEILNASATPTQSRYLDGETSVYVTSRLLPELGWWLVVEQNERGTLAVQQVLLVNLVLGALATGIVLITVVGTVNRYRRRLSNTAAVDALTGLINRPAYEFIFQQALLETDRSREPLSLILLEIDKFPRLNELLGRNAGDRILQNVAELACKSVRGTDPVSRWSGHRFLIQLRDCPLDKAIEVAERLRLSVAVHDFGADDPRAIVTVSLGVARRTALEPGNSFLDRAYEALGLAREQGGNRTEPAYSGAD